MDYVKKAQNDWQEPVNKIVDAVNGLMAGVEPTHLDNVISWVNGVTGQGAQAWYWPMGKYKLVFLWTNSFNATDEFKADDVAGILPSNLAPIHEINILTDRTNILANDYVNPTEFHLFKSDATGGKTSGIGSTMYLASN